MQVVWSHADVLRPLTAHVSAWPADGADGAVAVLHAGHHHRVHCAVGEQHLPLAALLAAEARVRGLHHPQESRQHPLTVPPNHSEESSFFIERNGGKTLCVIGTRRLGHGGLGAPS